LNAKTCCDRIKFEVEANRIKDSNYRCAAW
jgi:hypothetical protein